MWWQGLIILALAAIVLWHERHAIRARPVQYGIGIALVGVIVVAGLASALLS